MSGSGATAVSQKKGPSYSGQHEPGLKDQLEAVLARCDGFQVQTNNKGQNRKASMGSMSPNFDLYQPSNDYDKSVLSRSGYVFVKGPDSLGNMQEGYLKPSQVKAFSEWFRKSEPSQTTFLAEAARPKAPQATPNAKGQVGIAGRSIKEFKPRLLRSVGSNVPVTMPPNHGKAGAAQNSGDMKAQLDQIAAKLDSPSPSKAPRASYKPAATLSVAEGDLDSVSKPLSTTLDFGFRVNGEEKTIHLVGEALDAGNFQKFFGTSLKARYWNPSNYKETPPKGWLLLNERVLNGIDPKKPSGPSFIVRREDVSKELLPTLDQCDRKMREAIQTS